MVYNEDEFDDDLLMDEDEDAGTSFENVYDDDMEDDAAFGPPRWDSPEESYEDEDSEEDPAFRKVKGNFLVALLDTLGYYDPKRRKSVVTMMVTFAAAIILIMLLSLKKEDGTALIDIKDRGKKVEQAIEGGNTFTADDMTNESMSEATMKMKVNSTSPGKFARDLLYGEEYEEEDPELSLNAQEPVDELSVNPATPTAQEPPAPVITRQQARDNRREEILRNAGIGGSNSDAPEDAARTAKKKSQEGTVYSKYGVSEEAIRQAGITPEQFDAMMQGDYARAAGVSDVKQNIIASNPEAKAAVEAAAPTPDARIPVGTAPVRRSSGIQSLDSDSWGSSDRISSLEETTHVSTDEDHPFKVMFCRNEKVKSGQRVSLRLLEDMVVDNIVIPVNTHLDATLTIGNRISVTVPAIEINGRIHSLDLIGYDNDGGLGLYCPTPEGQDIAKQGGTEATSGAGGTLPGQLITAGTSLIGSVKTGQSVAVTSGYTFYLLHNKR